MPNTLSPRTIALVKATVPALERHGSEITSAMYRRLFQDPQIAALFNQANQKSGAQRFALANAVLVYARHIDDLGALGPAVERMAQKHVGYAILPEHYPHVATALLDAIAEVLGEAATPEILTAWGEAYWLLAEILQTREAQIRDEIMSRPGGWIDWRRFVVAGRQHEALDIMSFTLRPEDGGPVVPHKPGQYLTLRFDASGLAGVKRNYSISCATNDDHYRITVKREPGGEASGFLHDHALPGTVLEATPPAGDFHLPERPERPVVLLSGGVGLTPMVSMMEQIAARHRDLPAWYVHANRNAARHPLDAQVRAAAGRHGSTEIVTFYEDFAGEPNARPGRVTLDWLRKHTPLSEADIYLCGPKPFLRALVSDLTAAGIAADRIHYEFFGPADEQLAA